jgi:hypothetical protein
LKNTSTSLASCNATCSGNVAQACGDTNLLFSVYTQSKKNYLRFKAYFKINKAGSHFLRPEVPVFGTCYYLTIFKFLTKVIPGANAA